MNSRFLILLLTLFIFSCDSHKKQAEITFNKGLQMFNASKLDSSIILFQEAIKLDTSLSKARYYLSESYRRNKNYDAAISTLNSIKNKSIPIDSIYALYVKIYSNKDDYEKSIDYAKKVISLKPNSAEGHKELGRVYYNKASVAINSTESLELYKKALEQAIISIKINPNNNESMLLRGIIRLGIKDYSGALKDLNLVLMKEKKDKKILSSAYRFVGLVLKNQKKYTESLTYFDKAVKIKPDEGIFYFNRAFIKIALNMNNEACDDFRKAMELGETYAVDYIQFYCNK